MGKTDRPRNEFDLMLEQAAQSAQLQPGTNGSAGRNGAANGTPNGANGHPDALVPHPAELLARKQVALARAMRERKTAQTRLQSVHSASIPAVRSLYDENGRLGTVGEAAQKLREAGILGEVPAVQRTLPGTERIAWTKPTRRRMHPALSALILLLVVVAAGAFTWYTIQYYTDPATGIKQRRGDQLLRMGQTLVDPQGALLSAFHGNTQVQFLLVGLDHVPPTSYDPHPVHRSDSVMLVRTDLVNKQVRMLSIPRDGWVMHVTADGRELGYDKLAHSYANGTEQDRDDPEGGIKRTKATVEHLVGVPVDYYIIIEIDGFQKIIDALGGITIDVEKRMKYRDKHGELNIDLQPGVQRLNGEQAMGYSRFRHDAIGDIGRMARQQKVIKAIIEEMQKPENLPRLPTLAGLLNKSVKTNMGTDQLLALTRQAKKFDLNGFKSQTLPSYWNHDPDHPIDLPGARGMDAQYINPEEVEQYKQFLLDLTPPPAPEPAADGSAADGTAAEGAGADKDSATGSGKDAAGWK